MSVRRADPTTVAREMRGVAATAALGLLIGLGACTPVDLDDRTSASTTSAPEVPLDDTAGSVEGGPDSPDGDDQPGRGVTVTPGRAIWNTGYFQAAVYAALLAELGYTVDDPADHEYAPANAYLAMADGEIDFWANSWYPGHAGWQDQPLDDGTIVGDHLVVLGEQMPAGGVEGLVVTGGVAGAETITSLAQIHDDPDLVALFDGDGDGVAEIRGCPREWTCDDVIDEMLAVNGWDGRLVQITESFDDMMIDTVSDVQAGRPAIQYLWSPSGYLTELEPGGNVLWLSLGGADYVLDGSLTPEFAFRDAGPAALGDRCTETPCYTGWASADILVTANRDFVEANPVAAELFRQVTIDVLDVAEQNVRFANGEDSEADVVDQARSWIEENRQLVDDWLAAAREAA